MKIAISDSYDSPNPMKVIANDSTGLWEIHDEFGFLCHLESESTARLLASAPTLLNALEECITEEEAYCLDGNDPARMKRRITAISNTAKRAIAVATTPIEDDEEQL
jgi:hypothetical protein